MMYLFRDLREWIQRPLVLVWDWGLIDRMMRQLSLENHQLLASLAAPRQNFELEMSLLSRQF